MKRRKFIGRAETVPTVFLRGFLMTGLLGMVQSRGGKGRPAGSGRKILRQAIQGGSALAAGTAAAEALMRRNYSVALVALAGGAAGIAASQYLLETDSQEETSRVEEKF